MVDAMDGRRPSTEKDTENDSRRDKSLEIECQLFRNAVPSWAARRRRGRNGHRALVSMELTV